MKRIINLTFLLIISFLLISCDYNFLYSNKETNTTVSTFERRISTSNPVIELNAGEKVYLDYKLNFKLEEGESLTFASSDNEICKVLSTGYLLAKQKGDATVTVSYGDIKLTYYVYVNQEIELVAPTKLKYYLNEEIDLTGAELLFYNNDSTINKSVTITKDMILNFDTSTKGTKDIVIKYLNDEYHFTIEVLEREFEAYLVNDLIFPETITKNEKLEIKVENSNFNLLSSTLDSLYDYEEYKLVLEVVSPNQNKDTLNAFIYQDYKMTKTNTNLNSSLSLEGQVNKKDGYNYKLNFSKTNDKCYMFRYLPKETGTYNYLLKVYINNSTLVDTIDGEFNVLNGSETKGVIKVSSNKRTFEFENGDTYLAVGENVGWYTSKERRYGDYELWLKSLYENDCSYIRVWLSAWGYSLFWDNVKNYDTRLDEAYELDMLFDLLNEYDIYVDLSFFQHGMFSESVNPIWPNTKNTWYVDKYGANPYSKMLSSPGEFFVNAEAIKWTKNYLTYIVSRYGYSENILSYELFNEVDWVESYTKTIGNNWHDTMAKYIKSVDYSGHLVTTSVKGDDFTSDIYSVFNLDSIDYVNVHNYGTKNYLTYIPKKVTTAYTKFNKPIIYQEVGYGGNSGSDQLNKDPNDITLHQEIWAGLMSSTASGMNWWWDSWIEPNNSYSQYKGAGIYKDYLDLSGDLKFAYQNSRITNSNSKITTLGYLFDNKAYLYLFSTDYNVDNYNVNFTSTLKVKNMEKGTYVVKYFNTVTGEITKTENKTTNTLGTLELSISTKNDIAIIIEK